jgi:dTDP-4-dehydrorhamnose 3,5-epimerase
MKIGVLSIPDVLIIEPKILEDDRGFFESFNQLDFEKAANLFLRFVQENHYMSSRGVLRGLHF